jgi:hypothetical protein
LGARRAFRESGYIHAHALVRRTSAGTTSTSAY